MSEANPYSVTNLAVEPLSDENKVALPWVLIAALAVYSASAAVLWRTGTGRGNWWPPGTNADMQLAISCTAGCLGIWFRYLADRKQGRPPERTSLFGILIQAPCLVFLHYAGLNISDLIMTGMLTVGGFFVLYLYYDFRRIWNTAREVAHEEELHV